METRRSPRININLKIISRVDEETGQRFSLSKGNTFEVEAIDISILGIGIFSKYFLPKGLRIELELEGKPFDLDQPMKVKGEVCYSKYVEAHKYKCGVKFMDTSDKYTEKIAEFIKTYERRQEPRLKLQ